MYSITLKENQNLAVVFVLTYAYVQLITFLMIAYAQLNPSRMSNPNFEVSIVSTKIYHIFFLYLQFLKQIKG